MAWNDGIKGWLKGSIQELLKADGIDLDSRGVADDGNVPGDPNALPDANLDPAAQSSQQIGRKAIIDDPYFEQLSQNVIFKSKFSRLSNRTLKDVSVRDWIVSCIMQCRVDTLLRFGRPEHRKFMPGYKFIKKNPLEEYTDEDRELIRNLEEFIFNCGRTDNTPQSDQMLFSDFLKLAARDALTFGHIAVEKVKTRKGGLHRFRLLPGESVYLINKRMSKDYLVREYMNMRQVYRPGDNDPRKDEVINEANVEYYKYVQMSYDNRPMAIFGDEDMVWKLFNPQNFADMNGYCFPAKVASVLTKEGKVKYVEELSVGEQVFTHDGTISEVTHKKTRIHDGNVITVCANGLTPLTMTEEHPLLVAKEGKTAKDFIRFNKESIVPRWIAAKDIEKHDYLCIPKIKLSQTYQHVDMTRYGILSADGHVTRKANSKIAVDKKIKISEDLAWFLGLYLGDGCILNDKTVVIDLASHEVSYFDRIKKLFNSFGVNVTVRDLKGVKCKRVFIYSKLFTEMVKDLCPGNVHTKSINPLLLALSDKNKRSLLSGFIEADGNVTRDGHRVTAATVSPNLANSLALLANSLGILVKIKTRKSPHYVNVLTFATKGLLHNGINTLKGVCITFTKTTAYIEDSKYFYVKVGKTTTVPFNGRVYNVEVANKHSYLANQISSHNCYSPLELAIINITNHLNVENYNANFFTHGYAARGILHLKGTVTQSQLMNFRRQFFNTISGQQHAWRTPIVAGLDAVEWVPMSASAREMEYINFNNHLLRTICAQFQIDPIELGLDYLISANGRVPMQQANNEYKIAYSRERGLYPLFMYFEDMINVDIITALDPELAKRFKFVFTGYTDETAQTEIAQMQAEMTVWKSMNDLLTQCQKNKIDAEAAELPLNQAFWALVEKNYTRGEIRETFFGDKGASERRELAYIPGDPMFVTWAQNLLAIDAAKKQQQQVQQQMAAQQQESTADAAKAEHEKHLKEADHKRKQEQHRAEMEQTKANAAHNAVLHGNPQYDAAKQFGATSAQNVGGTEIANPLNKLK